MGARQDDDQVSHGLNLVLELRDPGKMPELLFNISQAQRKIDAGLGELDFVHFARFLPTYDNTALQVITEFDGPAEPYILDFAIEIGDVFDMLLGYTKGTAQLLPIAEHPAEFLAFVKEHNTVRVPGMPPVPEWGVYAAYPRQTVLDIVGARTDLPIPKADRWATVVDRADVQGNILQGYGAQRVRHFLLHVTDAAKARDWLARKAADGASPDAVPQLMSSRPWPAEAKPKHMLNVGLTCSGMVALGIGNAWLAPFPAAFREGALQRAEANFDVDSNAPGQWWLGGPQKAADIHVMLSLHEKANGNAALPSWDAVDTALRSALPGAGLEVLSVHDAADLEGGKNWFGYVEGLANPRIAKPCPVAGDRPDGPDLQPAAGAGEFILGAEHKNIFGGSSLGALPAALAANGSFCAVRVLAQDKAGFDDWLQREADRLHVGTEWLAAKLMGRWRGGAPLSRHPDQSPAVAVEHARNDFDYAPSYEYPDTPMDHAGHRCPVGAHIRRANHRTARTAGSRYARRLMRRGMHYETKDADGQLQETGLFGLFFCADLERQFEFIQRQWMNGDRFAAGLNGTRDPFGGTPRGSDEMFEIPMPDGTLQVKLQQFVHTKGSLYLFFPGLNALRKLDAFATPDPAISQQALARQTLHFDTRRRDFQIDPYPVFDEFRRNEPVHYSPLHDGWFVFRYDDVKRICTNNAEFSAAALHDVGVRGLFTLDPPEHTDVRARVTAAWNAVLAQIQGSIDRSITKALTALNGRCSFDLVDDFARPVPREVYFDILGGQGIGAKERAEIDELARTVMKHRNATLPPPQRYVAGVAWEKMRERFGQMLLQSAVPGSPYAGSFVAALAPMVNADRAGPFSQAAAMTTLANFAVAGYMSVEFLLATGIRRLLLLERAAGWGRILAEPGSVPRFVQEMRRTEHALSVINRFAKEYVELSHVTIPKGARVFGVLASANRDAVFGADADRFNPDRSWPQQPHLALGYGTHECLGRALEPLISEPAILRLVQAMPGLQLQSTAEPPWFEDFYFRSFDHLTVLRG